MPQFPINKLENRIKLKLFSSLAVSQLLLGRFMQQPEIQGVNQKL